MAVFLLITNTVSAAAGQVMGELLSKQNIGIHSDPTRYGNLISWFTMLPNALSIPFFLLSGLKMREVNRLKA